MNETCEHANIYNMKNTILISVLLFGLSQLTLAQDKWSLDECIDYAIENNIALKRQQVLTEQNKATLTQNRMSMLPNLNFQAQANMNFGRSVNPETNVITFNQNLLNSYWIGSGVTVFNGFATANRIAASKFMYKMGLELERVQKDKLSIDIIGAYYQVLMYRGVIKTATSQFEVSEYQLHRIKVMVETGAESRTTLLQLQSQVSNDKLLLTQAVNNELIALENLKQLLQLEAGLDFDISEESLLAQIDEELETNAESIFSIARSILPSISALDYKTKAREKEVKAAVGDATPELSLNAGLTTGYYDAMMEGEATTPFLEQVKNNNNQSVSATLSVPIFSRWFYRSNIKKAKLNLKDSELELQQELNTLYSMVSNATLELAAVKDEHIAIQDTKEFSDLAFDAVEKKFQTGLANTTEFAEARRQKFYAEVDLLRIKLQYNLKLMTLKYYLTGEWKDLK